MASIVNKERVPYRIWDKVNGVWNELKFKTNAKSVDANDGNTLEYKVGAINGITDSLVSESSSIAASSKAVKTLNDSLGGTQFQVIDGQIQWKETGADTWNFFSSNTSDVTFGMVYQYGTGDHISDIYSYNDNSVSISDNVITFKRSGTINVKYGVHCDNGKDFVGYCLNGVQTDFGNSLGMYEMELEISKGDTLYFLSSNTTTNRRTTLFGFVNFV